MKNEVKGQLLKAAKSGDRQATKYLLENGVEYNEIFAKTLLKSVDKSIVITVDNKEDTLEDLRDAIRKADYYDDLCQ